MLLFRGYMASGGGATELYVRCTQDPGLDKIVDGSKEINLGKNKIVKGSLQAFVKSTRKMSTFTAGCYQAARRALAAPNARWS